MGKIGRGIRKRRFLVRHLRDALIEYFSMYGLFPRRLLKIYLIILLVSQFLN